MSTQVEAVPTSVGDAVEMTAREAVNAALEDELASDPTVYMLGEDVASDGGVFKTNGGLLEKFPGRILNTPICENTFIGLAIGMSVTGLRPVVEIMFSDFLPTAADAIIEELPKFRFMTGGQCSLPVTVRSIGGGTGRFGTQHSATGESWFMAFPGLIVATAGTPAGIYGVLRASIRAQDPVLFFEHKGLYARKGPVVRGDQSIAEIGKAAVVRQGSDVTIVSTARCRQPRSSPRKASTPRSSTCAGCVRSTCPPCVRASRRPESSSWPRSRCTPPAGAPRSSRGS